MEVLLVIAGVLAGLVALVFLIMMLITVGRLVLVASLFVGRVVGLAAITAWWFVGSVLWWCVATGYMALVFGTAPLRIDVALCRWREADRRYLESVGLAAPELSGPSAGAARDTAQPAAPTLPAVVLPPSLLPPAVTLLLVGVFVVGPAVREHLADRSHCDEALLEETVDRWTRYLKARPGGLCSDQARKRQEAIPCERARRLDTVPAWAEYLEASPEGECAAEGVRRQESLECERLRLEDTEDGWAAYLVSNPQGSCAELAQDRIGALACEFARSVDTTQGWSDYLGRHPHGRCVDMGEDRLRQLACEAARAADSYTALSVFLAGQFRDGGDCSRLVAARVQELACEAARTGEISWRDYVYAHPEGPCLDEANTAIRTQECGEHRARGFAEVLVHRSDEVAYRCALRCGSACEFEETALYSYRWNNSGWRLEVPVALAEAVAGFLEDRAGVYNFESGGPQRRFGDAVVWANRNPRLIGSDDFSRMWASPLDPNALPGGPHSPQEQCSLIAGAVGCDR